MAKTSKEFVAGFADQNPRVGEFAPGPLDAEQLKALSGVVAAKVGELSQTSSADLTDSQRDFLRGTGAMGARSISYLVSRGAELPPMQGEYGNRMFGVMQTIPGEVSNEQMAQFGRDQDVTERMLGEVTQTGLPLDESTRPHQRGSVDQLAVDSLAAAAEIVSYNADRGRPLPVDPYDAYMVGNLNQVIALHELANEPPNPYL